MKRDWPDFTRQLVDDFGEERVYLVGIATMGYPPTFIQSHKEVRRLRKAMNRE